MRVADALAAEQHRAAGVVERVAQLGGRQSLVVEIAGQRAHRGHRVHRETLELRHVQRHRAIGEQQRRRVVRLQPVGHRREVHAHLARQLTAVGDQRVVVAAALQATPGVSTLQLCGAPRLAALARHVGAREHPGGDGAIEGEIGVPVVAVARHVDPHLRNSGAVGNRRASAHHCAQHHASASHAARSRGVIRSMKIVAGCSSRSFSAWIIEAAS